jgi:hypothetical protein
MINKKSEALSFSDKSSRGLYNWQLENGMQCAPPSDGCLLYYGENVDNIKHVTIHGPMNFIIEAGGAGRETKVMSDEQLLRHCTVKDARVRIRNFGHRKDLLASIPLTL